jgi:hypothetical protein
MFPNHRIRITASLTLIAIVTAATAIATPRKFTTDPGSGGNSMVFPTNSRPFGKTYGEWSAAHWQWLFSIPGPINPANDPTGVNAAVGQSGPVWFLAGSFCPEPPTPCSNFTLTRTITVPAGKALFFPIIDSECSTLEGNGTTEAELSACAEGFMNLATGMSCDVDGVPVQNLELLRRTGWIDQRFRFGWRVPDAPPAVCRLPYDSLHGCVSGLRLRNGHHLQHHGRGR